MLTARSLNSLRRCAISAKGWTCPLLEAGHIATRTHVSVRGMIAPADVVADDVESQAGRGAEHQVGNGVSRRIRPAADDVPPPGERRAPSLHGLIAHSRVHAYRHS